MLFSLQNKDLASELTLKREVLLKPLQLVAGVIERRQTIPILGNVVISVNKQELSILGSDSEIEIQGQAELEESIKKFDTITVSGRKLMDICRVLPEDCVIEIKAEQQGKVILSAGRSRFSLATLPAEEFPVIPEQKSVVDFSIAAKTLKGLVAKAYFAIPQQDTRQYLNGMLLEVKQGVLKTAASDGHRLAMNAAVFSSKDDSLAQVILPRKSVAELIRLLEDTDDQVSVGLNNNYIKVRGKNFIFTSKLIASKFPNYSNLIPKKGDKQVILNRNELKQSLLRVGILSNEMLRSFRLVLQNNLMQLFANNTEHEEASEEMPASYSGEKLEVVLNITYLLDILNNIDTDQVEVNFKDNESGVVIKGIDSEIESLFLIMPIRR